MERDSITAAHLWVIIFRGFGPSGGKIFRFQICVFARKSPGSSMIRAEDPRHRSLSVGGNVVRARRVTGEPVAHQPGRSGNSQLRPRANEQDHAIISLSVTEHLLRLDG